MIYRVGQFLTRDTASDRPEIRVEVVKDDRLTISAVDYPDLWWSVPQGRLLGEWREVPHPPVMVDDYESPTSAIEYVILDDSANLVESFDREDEAFDALAIYKQQAGPRDGEYALMVYGPHNAVRRLDAPDERFSHIPLETER